MHNFLHNLSKYNSKTRTVQPPKITKTVKRRLIRAAQTGKYSSTQLKTSLQVGISSRKVRELLHAHPTFKYKKRRSAPKLLSRHQEARVTWLFERAFAGRPNGTTWSSAMRKNQS